MAATYDMESRPAWPHRAIVTAGEPYGPPGLHGGPGGGGGGPAAGRGRARPRGRPPARARPATVNVRL